MNRKGDSSYSDLPNESRAAGSVSNHSFFQKVKMASVALYWAAEREKNLFFELCSAAASIAVAFFLGFSAIEFVVVLILIGCVLSTEVLNTAVEELANVVDPKYNKVIKYVKDLGAAAVLVWLVVGFFIAIVLYLPRLVVLAERFM